MKAAFVEFVRDLQGTVRARRQEKIREVEISWTAGELTAFRLFAMGLHASEKMDVCHALADAQATPLLEILTDFAEGEPDLMKGAFQAIEKTSTLARIFLAKKLMDSQKAEVRARTCALLGNCGGMAKRLLENALEDPDTKVQAAAIHALLHAGLAGSWQKLLPFLHSPDKETRIAALSAMARLGIRSERMTRDLLKILRNQKEDEQTRRISAGILARVSSAKGRSILLDAIRDPNAEYTLRLAAAEALAGYNDLPAIKAVLTAVYDPDANIAKTARLSLSRKHSHEFARILAQCLNDDDPGIAELAAELLGGLDSAFVETTLSEKLHTEHRLPLIIAVAKAMSHVGVPGAWAALVKKLHEDNIASPAFFSALADVANEENLSEFAGLFTQTGDAECRAVIMRRLAVFSQTSPVTEEIKELAERVLKLPEPAFHLAAATILAHIPELERESAALAIRRLGEHVSEPGAANAIRAMLRNRHGALAELFQDATPVAASLISAASREANHLGRQGPALFQKLASWARDAVPGAAEALRNLAALDPAPLIEAMPKCPDQLFLIEAWSHLSQRERLEHRPDLERFFASASSDDCLRVIHILETLQETWCLRDITTVVFTTKHEAVRSAAKKLAHSLILVRSEAA